MAGYVGPVVALGSAVTVAAGMVATGVWAAAAGIACTCAINTHQAAGEAFLQTIRSREDVKLQHGDTLAAAMKDGQFRRVARGNVILKSGISLAFTALAGPVARLFGGFSNEIVRLLLTHTPLDRVVGRELARSIEQSIIKSTSVKVGRWLANLSIRDGKGTDHISRGFNAVAGVARAVMAYTIGGVKTAPQDNTTPAPAAAAEFGEAARTPDIPTGLKMPPPALCAQPCPPRQLHI